MLNLLAPLAFGLSTALPADPVAYHDAEASAVYSLKLAATSGAPLNQPSRKINTGRRGKAQPVGKKSPALGMTEEPTGPEDCGIDNCGSGRPTGGSSGGGTRPPKGGGNDGKPTPDPSNCFGRQMTQEPTGCE